MQLEPKILANRFVQLEPMAPVHREALRAACDADPETWLKLYPYPMGGEHFDAGWARLYANPAADRMNHAVVVEGRCVGVSSYLAIDPANQSLEIGGTWNNAYLFWRNAILFG